MKRYLFIVLLISSSLSMFAEYALINKIVYSLSLGTLEAKVLNFQTNSSEVTIPPYVTYRGDKYTVTGLSYYAFDTDAYSTYRAADYISGGNEYYTEYETRKAMKKEEEEAPFQYDYKYVREGIVQLNLPNTITLISDEAFNGMRRLKNLTLPSSIKYFVSEKGYETVLHNMTRLERLVVLGVPILYEVREETVQIPTGNGFYKNERQTIIDTINMYSRNDKGEYIYKVKLGLRLGVDHCPNIQSYEVPKFDSFIAKIEANKPLFDKYNQYLIELAQAAKDKNPNRFIEIRTPQISEETLSDTALITEGYRQARKYLHARKTYASGDYLARKYKMQLDSALQAHPFYDGSKIEIRWGNIDEMETNPELINKRSAEVKKDMEEQYLAKENGGMEKNVRLNKPKKYVEGYCSIHPEMKAIADSVAKDYRCEGEDKQYRCVIEIIESGKTDVTSCRENTWKRNQDLFDSREEYDERYNLAKSNQVFSYEIEGRRHASFELLHMQNYVAEHIKDIKLSNINKKPNETTTKVIKYLTEFRNSYFYDRAVKSLMQSYPKVAKEYEKNSQYFSSEIEFFDAYTSDSYSAILKDKKKK